MCLPRTLGLAPAIFLALFLSAASGQSCLTESEPNDVLDNARTANGAFCIDGHGGTRDQDLVIWVLSEQGAQSLWQMSVAAGPGTAARLKLFALQLEADGTIAGQTSLLDRSGVTDRAASAVDSLLLEPGTYALAVAATEGSYRLDVAAVEPLPAAINAANVPPQTGGFEMFSAPVADAVVIPWTVTQDNAASTWTLSLLVPPASRARLTVSDVDGAELATSAKVDERGVVRLADLGLPSGNYLIVLDGGRDPTQGLLEAQASGRFDDRHEAEPNDRPEQASAFDPQAAVSGRLFASADEEVDTFQFHVGAALAGRVIDIVARAAQGHDLDLRLLDATGEVLLRRQSESGIVRFAKLGLEPGAYLLRLSGPTGAGNAYDLWVEDTGPRISGREWEPNDTLNLPGPFGPNDAVQGDFDGRDTDFYMLEVTGALQLWRLQVVGDQVTELRLVDSNGDTTARAEGQPGERIVRLSNLLLAPGLHRIAVEGTGGGYLLRALPIGPPTTDAVQTWEDAEAVVSANEAGQVTNEIEPNGTVSRAMALAPGVQRTGQIASSNDRDLYRFFLGADERVRIALNAPPGVELRADLGWGSARAHVARLLAVPSEGGVSQMVWDGLLPAGDYYLEIRADKHGLQPYGLLLERINFFIRPADIEPNDNWWQAGDVPESLRLSGELLAGDEDWYRLPALPAEAAFSATLQSDDPSVAGRIWLEAVAEVPPAVGDSWPTPDANTVRTLSGSDAAGWQGTLPAGVPLYLGVSGDTTRTYDIRLTIDGLTPRADPGPPSVGATLTLDRGEIAAFLVERQAIPGALRIENEGEAPLTLEVDGHVGDSRWRLVVPGQTVDLNPGQVVTLPIVLDVAADAWAGPPVAVDVAVRVPGSAAAVLAEVAIAPTVGGAAAHPTPGWTAPSAMLGGQNVGWSAHGAAVVDTEEPLNNGLVQSNNAAYWRNRVLVALDPTIDLAGDAPVPLAGVVLSPAITVTPVGNLRRFRILVSHDGETFAPVLEAALTPRPEPQAFAFAETVMATHLRLDPIDSHGGDGRGQGATLGDLAAIADPGFTLAPAGFDIGREELGAHIVWTLPQFDASGITSPGSRPPQVRLAADWDQPVEWVLGFYRNRAAQVTALTWRFSDERSSSNDVHGDIEVLAATAGPLGPWRSLGIWEIEPGPDGAVPPFRPAEPVWARYLRFVITPEAGTRRIDLADTIGVVERPVDDTYRSILGQWSSTTRDAIYEHLLPPQPAVTEADDNDSPERADPLALAETAAGTVERSVDEDWFRVTVAEPGRLTLTLDRRAGLDVAVRLQDASGIEIPFEAIEESEEARRYLAWVDAGDHHVLVTEPPRSILLTWDTSGSVASYVDAIFQAVRSFALGISPGIEEINFIPFDKRPLLLLSDWAADPARAFATLHAYDRRNVSSSDAQLTLLTASDALVDREGVRAIVVITDAESPGFDRTADLWRSLALSNPRIFTIGVPHGARDAAARSTENLLQDWAFLNNGFYQYLSSEAAVEVAFRRLAAWLRRPAGFALRVDHEAVERAPGLLQVVGAPDAAGMVSHGAIEVILDASGSMLQRIEGTRRIAIAKAVLAEMVTDILQPGTPFVLRVFGQGPPDSCETGLVAPLAPLDPAALTALIDPIQPTNLARTPIGASLALVADDLAGIVGPRLIVLLTDGEETCDGEPAAAIQALRQAGLEVRINIVGFAIDDPALADTFGQWATAGGGSYFSAADQDSLREALFTSVRPAFEVLRGDAVIATGRVGGESVTLPSGRYNLRVLSVPEYRVEDVVVGPEIATIVTIE